MKNKHLKSRLEMVGEDKMLDYTCTYPDVNGEVICPFDCDCLDCQYAEKGGENITTKQTEIDLNSKDFGENTLAKIGPEGVEFLLVSIETGTGQFGSFRKLVGKQNGQPFDIKVSSKPTIRALDKNPGLLGRVIKIIPSGEGMQKSYQIKTVD